MPAGCAKPSGDPSDTHQFWHDAIKTDCRSSGYVETIFGRKCWIPGIRDTNPARRAGAERQAINAPLQGSAADIIKRAMARIPAALAREGLRAHAATGA